MWPPLFYANSPSYFKHWSFWILAKAAHQNLFHFTKEFKNWELGNPLAFIFCQIMVRIIFLYEMCYYNVGKILCQFKSWKYCLQTWEQELQNFPVTALPATKPIIYKVWNESLLSGNASLCLDSSQNAMKFSQSLINADIFLPLW